MSDSEWHCHCTYYAAEIVDVRSKWRCFGPDGAKGSEIHVATTRTDKLALVAASGNYVKVETSNVGTYDGKGTYGPINDGDKLEYNDVNTDFKINGHVVKPVQLPT